MLGKHINGRYKLLEVIGDGGMAIVYSALDLILDRTVAVKLLRPEFSTDDDFIKRFRREAESATSLDHPNIVSIYDVGEEEDFYYIVMEYVAGTTLKQKIRNRGALPIEESIDIMKQMTSAIEHAHENHIIHRDIKPHNILINEFGEAKVTDFGIAMAMTSATITHTNSVLGSVHYFSPEQARGGIANERSDIYSLGVVLYEMVTGVLPFSGDSPVSVALKHLQDKFPKPSLINTSLPKNIENIIMRAMAKEPLQRFQSAQELYDALDVALDPTKVYDKPLESSDDEATKVLAPVTPNRSEHTQEHQPMGPVEKNESSQHLPPKKKKKARKVTLIVFLILLLLGGAGALAFTFIPGLFYVSDVEVPDVTGMSFEEARTSLIDQNFDVKKEEQFNEEVEEDDVISQDPESGTMVKENSTITLNVSMGAEKVELDDFIGKSKSEVETLLDQQGFENVTFETEHRDDPEGEIYDQSPEAGKMVLPTEDRIIIWYSTGPEPILLEDLSGKTKEEAEAYASAENRELKVSYEEPEYSDTVEEGSVISHDPGTAAQLNKGDEIKLTLSKGKEPEPEPETEPEPKPDPEPEPDPEPSPEDQAIVVPNSFKIDVKEGEEHLIEILYTDSTTEGEEISEKITETKEIKFDLTIYPGEEASYKTLVDGKEKKENSKTITYDQAKQKYGKKE